ncbi:alpha/beta fold hydrolase family protein [Salidesulfovibrio brasiliensis]|uniref:alpha/beta fold hydrolase n=1 Tax=Salidesulfovibrio brasiliensis TaxID=221711 RepID=UPI000AEFD17A|nr:alpha/beta fold hydrolase [Salidesulfovibrio brasiliensis]
MNGTLKTKAPTSLLLALLACLWAATAFGEPFPIQDPYQATVFGTPPQKVLHFKAPAKTEEQSIVIDGRTVPDIFWYDEELRYTTAMQPGQAPLLFIIAGTGGEHNSPKMRFLTQLFHQSGYHVVSLSSPTHMNFVVSASQYAAPGYVPYDVEDLYRTMLWIKTDLAKEHAISGFSVTGYSLGAMHSAFLARLDDLRGDFSFDRVLLINPPVDLHRSALRFDAWLGPKNLGDKKPRQVIDELIKAFSEIYKHSQITDFDDNFLYALYKHESISDMNLRAIIAADFRLTSTNMIFSSDVCIKAGYIVPADKTLTSGDPLLPYARAAAAVSFEAYVDEYLLPYIQYLEPGTRKADLIHRCSLHSIRDYLSVSDKIVLIGNEDDVILGPDEVDFLRQTFGARAHLYPHGGHCGNLTFKPFARHMQELMKP